MLNLASERPLLVGVVHLAPTPGSPRATGSGALGELVERAVDDARAWVAGGADALVVENFGDVPFHATAVPPETVAAMALAIGAVRAAAPDLPVGVNVLRNDARAALGLAAATGAAFVRINVHAGVMITDQGRIEGRAAETVRERDRLCPDVKLLCDVHVKHAVPVAGETIEQATSDLVERALADAVIVSGAGTGSPPTPERVARVARAAGRVPVLLGSGVTSANARELVLPSAAGAILGTAAKEDGDVHRPVDPDRVRTLRRALDGR